jgi:glycosyltransferase involved in cell wall biosynthesis
MTLLAMNTTKHYFDLKGQNNPFDHYQEIITVDIDNTIKLKDAFLNLFSRQSFHISRFVSRDFEKALIRLLKRSSFDVIQLETLYLAPYIPLIRKYSDARISMRAHNVESEIWTRITNNTSSFPKKIYLKYLSDKLHRFECRMLHHYDILMPITSRDLGIFRQMGFKGNAVVVPIGLDSTEYKADYDSFRKKLSISFIGSLDWMPNIEGLRWFLKNVWGKIQKELPGIQLHIAGRNTPDWLKNIKKKNIVVHGEVEDAAAFINEHSIMVVPLLSGSGMRAKILEGMALGKVVLTTRIGLEGIDATDKQEILIGDDVRDMVKAVKWCSKQNGRLEMVGRRACDFVQSNYDSMEIARKVYKAYSSTTVEIV